MTPNQIKKQRYGVAGTKTDVGGEIIKLLEELGLDSERILLLDGKEHDPPLHENDLLFLAESSNIEKARTARTRIIDVSGQYRMDPEIPLIVPEINGDMARKCRFAASPSAGAIALAMALAPLHALASVQRVVVTLFVPTLSAGRPGMDELFSQTRGIFMNEPIRPQRFTKQIAFNLIPHVGNFMEDGSTEEEWRLGAEIKKILDPKIRVSSQFVQAPLFAGLALTANIELANEISETKLRTGIRRMKGLALVDHRHDEGYVTPAECVGESAVFVSRLHIDPTRDDTIWLWVTTDALLKGSAFNAIQIAELMDPGFPRLAPKENEDEEEGENEEGENEDDKLT